MTQHDDDNVFRDLILCGTKYIANVVSAALFAHPDSDVGIEMHLQK